MQNSSGDWYTRYDFVTGTPDTTFGIPEYDSVGLFLIGVSQYYKLTHNMTFLNKVNKSVIKAINWIEDNSKGHLLPEDLSVWESTYSYNFWTQAFDDLGLKYISEIPYYTNFVNETVEENLKKSTLSAFYINNSFISGAVTPAVLFENGKSMIVYSTVYGADSSTILPIAMGYLPPSSIIGINDAKTIVKLLTIKGGIARFYDDQYHYSIPPIDSSAPTPPWIITTLFLAYYYEYIGNYSGALNLMEWCVEHLMHGLLPEAVDPIYETHYPQLRH